MELHEVLNTIIPYVFFFACIGVNHVYPIRESNERSIKKRSRKPAIAGHKDCISHLWRMAYNPVGWRGRSYTSYIVLFCLVFFKLRTSINISHDM